MNTQADQAPSQRTRVRQSSKRAVYEKQALYEVLDASSIGHVAFMYGGVPHSIPTAIARIEDGLWLHGSRSSRMFKVLAAGDAVSISTCLVDGLVKARSAMHCSMNYRSAVVFGKGEAVTGDAKEQILNLFTEKLIPGSKGEFRPHLAKELKATELIRIPLDEASCKVRTGGPIDDEEDISLAYWAGVIPLECVAGTPIPESDLPASVDVPEAMKGTFR